MTNTKEIILKLKEVREEKGLSYGDILEIMEKQGDFVSEMKRYTNGRTKEICVRCDDDDGGQYDEEELSRAEFATECSDDIRLLGLPGRNSRDLREVTGKCKDCEDDQDDERLNVIEE